MRDFLDYIVIWLPILLVLVSWLLVGFIVSRDAAGIARFELFTRIFLKDGGTLKTWGLFLATGTFCLLLSGGLAKLATDASFPRDAGTAALRIKAIFELAIGLEVLLSLCIGSFGAIAFKGQGPGGTSLEVRQDPAGVTTTSATGPAPPPAVSP